MKSLVFSLAASALLATLAPTAAQARARLLAAPLTAAPTPPTDTIIVRLPNKAVLTLTVRDAAQLRELPKYHLDSLVARLGGYIKQAERAAETGTGPRVTVDFYPAKDQPGQGLPEQVRITTRKKTGDFGVSSTRVDAALDRAFGLQMRLDQDGKKTYVTGTSESRAARRDSVRLTKDDHGHQTEFRLDLGLNVFVNKQSYTPSPGVVGGNFELRPEGSRYVNLGFNYVQRLGGKGSPVYLSLGPEFAFNSYMLRGNNRWVNINNRTEVVTETGRQLQKSKLATTTLNLPLMLGVRLRDKQGHRTLLLAGGGFVGYLLGQHTKIKYYQEGNTFKDKDHGSFNLNELQYGLQGQLGIGDLTLFAKYNLNELFKDKRGPQTQVLSFGLTIAGI